MTPETLTLDHFGPHRATVLAAFAGAFEFGWDPEVGESQAAAIARQRLRRGIEATQQKPPGGHARAAELFKKIYGLRQQLHDRLFPGGSAWRDQVIELATAAAIAGQRLAHLRSRPGLSTLGPETGAELLQLAARWDRIESQLDAARYDIPSGQTRAGTPQGEALAATDEEVGTVCAALLVLERSAAAAHLAEAIESTREAVTALKDLLDRAVVCAPPPPDFGPNPFRNYFNRLVWALPVTRYRRTRRAHTAGAADDQYEIPVEWLVVARTDEERREVILCWLATFKREFWDYLPTPCRRDHPPPPRTGGSSNRNVVLDGIAAAMVLAGQVPPARDDDSLDGAELFARVVRRTRSLLSRAGKSGRLAVDPTGTKLPPVQPILYGDSESWGGREDACIRPPLIEELPYRVERLPDDRTAD